VPTIRPATRAWPPTRSRRRSPASSGAVRPCHAIAGAVAS